jgi:hypothetical protein
MNYILNEQHGKKIAVILNGMCLGFAPFEISTYLGLQNLVTVSKSLYQSLASLSNELSCGYREILDGQ